MPICGLSRFTAWATLSAILGAAVVQHALATREQFYPAVIYLATSKFSVVVLANLAAVLLVGVARLVKVVFLGDLRPREVEVRGWVSGCLTSGRFTSAHRSACVSPR